MAKTIIVEGNSIANNLIKYRKPEKTNEPNSVVLEFCEHIREIVSKYEPENLVVIWPSSPTTSPSEYSSINKIMMSMGIPIIELPSSSVGHYIQSLKSQIDNEIIISSMSTAALQLIDNRTQVLRQDSFSQVSEQSLYAEVGIRPKQVIDFVAISGDSDFNIGSVFGQNVALDWLRKYENIEGIAHNAQKINGAMRNLFLMKKNKLLSQRSISDFSDFHVISEDISIPTIARNSVNIESLHMLCIENKIFEWLPSDIREKYAPKTNLDSDITYSIEVKSQSGRENFLNKLQKGKGVSFYLTGDYASFSTKKGESFVMSIFDAENMNLIKQVLSNPEQKIVTHDAKSLMHWGYANAINVNGIVSDSAILAYTIDSANKELQYHHLAKSVLGISLDKVKDQSESMKIRHAGEASDLIMRLNKSLYQMAIDDQGSKYVFEKIDLPLITTLFEMEKNGVNIDVDSINKFNIEITERLENISNKINSVAGREIGLTSPANVAEYIFDIIKAPSRSGNGSKRSTSEAVLSEIKDFHETIPLISEFRKLDKIKGSYITPYLRSVSKEQPRLFANFLQNVAATSRLSCRNPNLQAIPINSKDGARIRSAFSAPENSKIIAMDYSQIELRVLAHLSQDKDLLSAFNSGIDIHLATAARVFGLSPEEVTGQQRKAAKAINFGIIYGMSEFGLSTKLNCTPKKAGEFIDNYFKMYPGVSVFLTNTVAKARKDGFVSTIFGRKLYHPELRSSDFKTRTSAERAAVNAPMQGSASEIIKIAMNNVSKMLKEQNLKTKMLMQVHDELVFEVPDNEVELIFKKVKEIMENSVKISVPLIVDAEIGKDWASSHSLDQFKNNIPDMSPR